MLRVWVAPALGRRHNWSIRCLKVAIFVSGAVNIAPRSYLLMTNAWLHVLHVKVSAVIVTPITVNSHGV